MNNQLENKLILVTRPQAQAQELCDLFTARGARTLCQPAIEIRETDKLEALDAELRRLVAKRYNLVIFTSANGVEFAFKRLVKISGMTTHSEVGALITSLDARVAAIGPGTARALNAFGVTPSIMPERYDSDGLVEALRNECGALGAVRALAFRANRGRAALGVALHAAAAQYVEAEAYQNVDVLHANAATLRALAANEVAAAVVTSSASANALFNMLGAAVARTKWVALSELTARAFETRGVKVAAVARVATLPALVDAVAELLS